MMNEPKILFEDPHLIVLSKPTGLLSQGDHTGVENLVDWLRAYLGRNYVGLIHRLDRNTSGIMIIAKRTKAATRLTESLQKGSLKRTYLAWIEGSFQEPQIWKHWLAKNEKTNEVKVVKKGSDHSKEAVLSVTPLKAGFFKKHPLTLAKFILETGRSHQIRVQSAAEKHPIVGDPKYGSFQEDLKKIFDRPALHSFQLSFPHPMSNEVMSFEAPLPSDFKRAESLIETGKL